MNLECITLREVNKEDKDLLLKLKNNPKTRRFSINTHIISDEEHSDWFKTVFNNPARKQLIGIDKNQKPIGQIRLDISRSHVAEIDVSVASEERGKGYGSELIRQGCQYGLTNLKINEFIAKVKIENEASIKSFLKAGFIEEKKEIFENEELVLLKLLKKMDNTFVISTIKSWNIANFKKLNEKNKENKFYLITEEEQLNLKELRQINPKYIFFPHWSWKIPECIYENFECVVFHMTDLPYGRGGSPFQNLISRGIYETKISAIKVGKELDCGDIYCKEPLNIKQGSAEEIFKKASEIIYNKMIHYIIKNNPIPKKQQGEIVMFKRRNAKQSDISKLDDITRIYDYIRMLDAEGYPNASLETENFKVEFNNAKINGEEIVASCIIKLKGKNE